MVVFVLLNLCGNKLSQEIHLVVLESSELPQIGAFLDYEMKHVDSPAPPGKISPISEVSFTNI